MSHRPVRCRIQQLGEPCRSTGRTAGAVRRRTGPAWEDGVAGERIPAIAVVVCDVRQPHGAWCPGSAMAVSFENPAVRVDRLRLTLDSGASGEAEVRSRRRPR